MAYIALFFSLSMCGTSIRFETLQYRPDFLFHPSPAKALGLHNRLQPGRGLLDPIVDQNVVVLGIIPDLLRGRLQTSLDYGLAVLRPRTQALLQNLARRRKHKDTNRLRDRYL